MKESAGTLLYRKLDKKLTVLLVHPSGNYNINAPWGIPKGGPEPGETLEEAARRETLEEVGVKVGHLVELGFIDYVRSKKRIHCFVSEAPSDQEPHCASWEIDQAQFFSIEKAKEVIHEDQVPFLDRLQELLNCQS
jgi:predicted NUDIX family NTP pyrophosphohydrolase